MSRILIFANGVLSAPPVLQPTDRIFCADGGTIHVLGLGLTPHAIIGDLDSLSPELVALMKRDGVAIHRYPVHKNETDLELAIQLALAEQPTEILLVAALGGRLDQMLANILLLTRYQLKGNDRPTEFILLEGKQTARLLQAHQTMTIHGQPGDTVSLIPLTPVVTEVMLTNVAWPLDKAMLSLGSTLTISNVLTATTATVQIGEGMVLVVQIAN